jgi:transcriptional regulator with XRE-family HTH domain
MLVSELQGNPVRAARQSRLVTFGPDQRERKQLLLDFGETLRGMRREAHLTQEALAVRCFIGRDRISGLECGKRAPDLPALLVLANRLGVSVATLTDGLEAPVRKVGTAQVLDLVAREPASKADALAASLALPWWYVNDIIVYLQSIGAIVREGGGWRAVVGCG